MWLIVFAAEQKINASQECRPNWQEEQAKLIKCLLILQLSCSVPYKITAACIPFILIVTYKVAGHPINMQRMFSHKRLSALLLRRF